MSHISHLTPAARCVARPAPRRVDREVLDYCSKEGASLLKAKIENYWRERGQDVTVSILGMGFHPVVRSTRFDIRSDLINGAPRKRVRRLDDNKVPPSLSTT